MLKGKLLFLYFLLGLLLPFSFASAGTVLGDYKYSWSDNVGYINFENVVVGNSTLSGYAWSKTHGWIKFNPAQGGVLNDGSGNLSGYAWGEQLGWIDFDNVSINISTGKFSGTATGTLIGTLTFDCSNYCDVRTDWRPSCSAVANASSYNAYPTCGPATCNSGYTVSGGSCVASGGGGGGGSPSTPTTPTTPTEPSSPTEPTSGDPSDPSNPEGQPNIESPGNKDTQNNDIPSNPSSDNQQSTTKTIDQFFRDLQKQEPIAKSDENRQESYNTPLTVEPEQSGLLVWDFTTPEMAKESKKEAVIIELPREISSDAVTISVKLTSPKLPINGEQTTLLGAVFDVTAINKNGEEVHRFNKPIKITLIISENLRHQKDLGVYFLADKAGNWTLIPDAVFDDTSATFFVDHLTHFAIFAVVGVPKIISITPNTSHLSGWFYIILAIVFVILWFFYYRRHLKIDRNSQS